MPRKFLPALTCSIDEGAEDGARSRILLHRALGMPLHREHEMIRRGSFDGLNDAIVRTARDNAQPISQHVCGLMMRRVNGYYERTLDL